MPVSSSRIPLCSGCTISRLAVLNSTANHSAAVFRFEVQIFEKPHHQFEDVLRPLALVALSISPHEGRPTGLHAGEPHLPATALHAGNTEATLSIHRADFLPEDGRRPLTVVRRNTNAGRDTVRARNRHVTGGDRSTSVVTSVPASGGPWTLRVSNPSLDRPSSTIPNVIGNRDLQDIASVRAKPAQTGQPRTYRPEEFEPRLGCHRKFTRRLFFRSVGNESAVHYSLRIHQLEIIPPIPDYSNQPQLRHQVQRRVQSTVRDYQ